MENKKKILVFIPEFPRISETFIERDLSKLVELGNLNITVFSLAKASGTLSLNLRDIVKYERLSLGTMFSAFFSYILLHPIKIYKIKLKILLKQDSVPRLFSLRSTNNDLRAKQSIMGRFHNSRAVHFLKGIGYAKLMSKYNPDEIHAHFLSAESNIAMVAAMVLEVPFSISAHAKDVLVEPSLAELKARYAKFITVCNQNAYDACVNLAKDNASNIHLGYHGLDSAKLFSRPTELKKPERPVVFPGGTRLVEKKGLRYLIEASKILKDRGIGHQIDFVGPTSQNEPGRYQEYQKIASDLGISDQIIMHGDGKGTPNELVMQFYQIATVFCLPSITTGEGDADGIPNTIIEAAMAKLPIVTTNAGSISELIIHNETGLVVEQKNPHQIADAIERLIFDTELSTRLGEAAFSKATQMFNQEKNVAELEKLLLNN